jgi:hypothetical protein
MEIKFNIKGLNGKATFINNISKLLIGSNISNNITKTLDEIILLTIGKKEFKKIYDGAHDNIRNLYELVDERSVPLFSLYDLTHFGKENYGFDDEELEIAKKECIEKCKLLLKQ